MSEVLRLPFEPDAIIECTGVGAVIADSIQKIGSGGVVCLTGVGQGGRSGYAVADVSAMGSVMIGLLLIVIAIVLIVEMKSLLIGEAASDATRDTIAVTSCPRIRCATHRPPARIDGGSAAQSKRMSAPRTAATTPAPSHAPHTEARIIDTSVREPTATVDFTPWISFNRAACAHSSVTRK